MITLKSIQSQDNAVRYLSRSLLAGKRASSYLFFGPDGVGRALTAKAFLAAVMCREADQSDEACGVCPSCRKVKELNHPDIMWISPEKNKKIKIEEIRKIKDTLNLKPYEGTVSACVIEDAHMMTVEGANALLKILEEPPQSSILILISSKKELLLPTVTSRCTEVRFNSLPTGVARDIIIGRAEINEESADFLARFSEGAPGRALEVIDKGILDRRQDIIGMLRKIACGETPHLEWDEGGKDALLEDLELLIMFFRDIAVEKPEMNDFFEKYPLERTYDIVVRLIGLRQALLGNVNPKLVAQALPGILK
jgi:DNA polymerase-3 subunit delta'